MTDSLAYLFPSYIPEYQIWNPKVDNHLSSESLDDIIALLEETSPSNYYHSTLNTAIALTKDSFTAKEKNSRFNLRKDKGNKDKGNEDKCNKDKGNKDKCNKDGDEIIVKKDAEEKEDIRRKNKGGLLPKPPLLDVKNLFT